MAKFGWQEAVIGSSAAVSPVVSPLPSVPA